SLEDLSQIEVTTPSRQPESALRTPAAVYVITGEDIRRSGVTTIPEALRLARSVLVLIDGRTVYTPLFAGTYWEVQDTLLEDIDRIEVIRGPGGTIWGPDAVNGVINIITKNARDTRGALISGGSGNVNQGFVNMRYGSGNDRNFNYRVYSKASTTGPEYHYN